MLNEPLRGKHFNCLALIRNAFFRHQTQEAISKGLSVTVGGQNPLISSEEVFFSSGKSVNLIGGDMIKTFDLFPYPESATSIVAALANSQSNCKMRIYGEISSIPESYEHTGTVFDIQT